MDRYIIGFLRCTGRAWAFGYYYDHAPVRDEEISRVVDFANAIKGI
jgi:hypothetical protein